MRESESLAFTTHVAPNVIRLHQPVLTKRSGGSRSEHKSRQSAIKAIQAYDDSSVE